MTKVFTYGEKEYSISSNGDVVDIQTGKLKTVYITSNGYKIVSLGRYGKRSSVFVHRIIAINFIENPNNYPVVNHKDLNKLNNALYNLEWTTQKGNCNHFISHSSGIRRGENNGFSKLTEQNVRNIRKEYLAGGITVRKLAIKYGMKYGGIRSVINKTNWNHI